MRNGAQGPNVGLQVLDVIVRGNFPRGQNLPKLPKRQARQLAGFTDRQASRGVEVDRHLDLELLLGQPR